LSLWIVAKHFIDPSLSQLVSDDIDLIEPTYLLKIVYNCKFIDVGIQEQASDLIELRNKLHGLQFICLTLEYPKPPIDLQLLKKLKIYRTFKELDTLFTNLKNDLSKAK